MRPWQKLAGGTPTLGTTCPGKPAVGPYELCPGGSGQLPPQAPGLSGCPEHPSRGTASPAGTRDPHFCRGMPAAFPTSSRTRLLVHRPQLHWAGPGYLGQPSSVTLRGTGVDELHPQGPGHDTHTPKRRGVLELSGQAQRPECGLAPHLWRLSGCLPLHSCLPPPFPLPAPRCYGDRAIETPG